MIFSYNFPGIGITVTIKELRGISTSLDYQTGKIEYKLESIYGDEDVLLLPITMAAIIKNES